MDIKQQLGNTDIYLIDQILKGTYSEGEKLLDAGIGGGRNLHWFAQHNFELHGIDAQFERIQFVKELYPHHAKHFLQADLANLPYPESTFDHIICSAVLHFATSEQHFLAMFSELASVLKPKGTLFIRMTSNFGIQTQFRHLKDGVYSLNDQSTRFLLTHSLLKQVIDQHSLQLIEPLKTTNVSDLRCMSTLMFEKK